MFVATIVLQLYRLNEQVVLGTAGVAEGIAHRMKALKPAER
jgi:hypothetical protein